MFFTLRGPVAVELEFRQLGKENSFLLWVRSGLYHSDRKSQ